MTNLTERTPGGVDKKNQRDSPPFSQKIRKLDVFQNTSNGKKVRRISVEQKPLDLSGVRVSNDC